MSVFLASVLLWKKLNENFWYFKITENRQIQNTKCKKKKFNIGQSKLQILWANFFFFLLSLMLTLWAPSTNFHIKWTLAIFYRSSQFESLLCTTTSNDFLKKDKCVYIWRKYIYIPSNVYQNLLRAIDSYCRPIQDCSIYHCTTFPLQLKLFPVTVITVSYKY